MEGSGSVQIQLRIRIQEAQKHPDPEQWCRGRGFRAAWSISYSVPVPCFGSWVRTWFRKTKIVPTLKLLTISEYFQVPEGVSFIGQLSGDLVSFAECCFFQIFSGKNMEESPVYYKTKSHVCPRYFRSASVDGSGARRHQVHVLLRGPPREASGEQERRLRDSSKERENCPSILPLMTPQIRNPGCFTVPSVPIIVVLFLTLFWRRVLILKEITDVCSEISKTFIKCTSTKKL